MIRLRKLSGVHYYDPCESVPLQAIEGWEIVGMTMRLLPREMPPLDTTEAATVAI